MMGRIEIMIGLIMIMFRRLEMTRASNTLLFRESGGPVKSTLIAKVLPDSSNTGIKTIDRPYSHRIPGLKPEGRVSL